MKQRIDQLTPLALVAVFTVVVQGLSLMEFLPPPIALLIAAGWAVLIGLAARWANRRPALSAWAEDGLVALGCVTMALFAFGGAVGLMMLGTALDSSSITGETMVTMFLPSIPIAIAANVPTELLVIPGLLVLGWRPGARRILFVTAATLYFVHRIWTYLVFVPDRLDFAAAERSTAVLTAAEKVQFAAALHVDDPRWILNLLIFGVFLLSAFFSRSRRRGRLLGESSRSAATSPTRIGCT
ncbi:hypothetical protein I0C86_25600 [Plantactinospora sp. S1510]|uniref:Uncharacterized protein n=1 Tax=Plantactinospora alkalitolerans TaxID=2789879 RepID=A0ABS0H1F5_9ACTN|nr:hypothetical protein [Plantactinospora alkalitolerans]MBF9132296.1 hypothetical protein [Plantactinospora alkalitolerans]